jgi:phenylacetate-coenzyme A ligase PaaK-like adenylate-forming protein
VLRTGFSQMMFVTSMLSGRRLRGRNVLALASDMRQTLERFGTLGQDAADMIGAAADPELQRDMTRRRLRSTIRRAARETPYYRSWFAGAGVDPDSVTIESLGTITPTPKSALRSMPAAFVSDRSAPTMAAHTTGTTGIPTVVWFSRHELDVLAGMSAMALMLGGFRPNHVWANCMSSRAIPATTMSRSIEITGGAFLQLGLIDPRDALDRLATPLHLPGKEPQITHLNTVPSYLAALVQEAERAGWRAEDFGLTEIRLGGEVLTDSLARRAADAFGAEISESYGMTEILPVGGQVCTTGHLHVPMDHGYVEVLDPATHEPAAPGTVGELTITPYTAYRETTMLLRYATGDLVKVLPDGEQANCELAAIPATSKILGRVSGSAISTRDILDLLQDEPALPLPTRYAFGEADDVLYVVGDPGDRSVLARLDERITELAMPLRGIVLVEDPGKLPSPCHIRADLREHSFNRPLHDCWSMA